MQKKAFIEKVLKARPNFRSLDTYFFLTPFNHVLSGFCCELTPTGAYVWKFLYPTFERCAELSLLYSERMDPPDGYIDYSLIPKSRLVPEFLERTDRHLEEAKSYLSLERFYDSLKDYHALSNNGYVRYTLACALLLLHKREGARSHLEEAKRSAAAERDAAFHNDVNELLDAFDERRDAEARAMIYGFEGRLMEVLGGNTPKEKS